MSSVAPPADSYRPAAGSRRVEDTEPPAASAWALGRLVASSGDLLTTGIAAFTLVATVALLAGEFRPAVVLGIGAPAAIAAVLLLRPERAVDPPRGAVLGTGLAALLATGSTYVSMRISGEFVFAWRDPGTYGIAGRWLYDHPAMVMPQDNSIFGGVAGLDPNSLGFGLVDGAVQAQGYHGLPAVLAAGAWLVGDPHFVYDVNPIIGGFALLALYTLARRVVGPWFALLPVATLAASMPFIAFTRDTYSEPLALLFAAGSMSLLWRAVTSRRLVDFGIAGLVAGAGGLVRVDAYVTLLGFVAALMLFVATAGRRDAKGALARAALALVAAVVPVAVGVLDVSRLSALYWQRDLDDQAELLALTAGAIVVLGLLAAVIAWWTPVGGWVDGHRVLLGRVCGVAALAVFAVFVSRPLWWVSYQNNPPGFESLRAFQTSLGVPVEVTRSYEELSVNWIAWYHGWAAVLLGGVGLALLLYRTLADRVVGAGYFLFATSGTALLYLHQSSIFPDQVWAMRRYLPVVIPGILIGAAAALAWCAARRGRWRVPMVTVAVVGSAAVFAWTAAITYPMLRVPSYRPQLAEVESVCLALPPDAALLVVDDAGQARGGYQSAFRAFCEIPVMGLEAPSPAVLARAADAVRARGLEPYVASMVLEDVPWSTEPTEPWLRSEVVKWPERLLEPPRDAHVFVRDLYLGSVRPDGLVDLAPPPVDATLDPDSVPPEAE